MPEWAGRGRKEEVHATVSAWVIDRAQDSIPDSNFSDEAAFSYSMPSFCWIFSSEMPLVSGMIESTQINCPTMQSA